MRWISVSTASLVALTVSSGCEAWQTPRGARTPVERRALEAELKKKGLVVKSAAANVTAKQILRGVSDDGKALIPLTVQDVAAAAPNAPPVPVNPDNPAVASGTAKGADHQQKWEEFTNAHFGFGPSIAFDIGGKKRVNTARVVNDRVRVDEEDTAQTRLLLESHYFFSVGEEATFLGLPSTEQRWGMGPYVGVQSTVDEFITSYVLGWMIGFKYLDNSKGSFNLGLGALFDPNKQVLGDNVRANKENPDGNQAAVRTKKELGFGAVITLSFSF